MAKISYMKFPIETISDDGTRLKGIITYWAKDYSVHLQDPVKAKMYGGHIPYMFPVKFIVNKNSEDHLLIENGKHYINLHDKSKEMLKKLYQQNKRDNKSTMRRYICQKFKKKFL